MRGGFAGGFPNMGDPVYAGHLPLRRSRTGLMWSLENRQHSGPWTEFLRAQKRITEQLIKPSKWENKDFLCIHLYFICCLHKIKARVFWMKANSGLTGGLVHVLWMKHPGCGGTAGRGGGCWRGRNNCSTSNAVITITIKGRERPRKPFKVKGLILDKTTWRKRHCTSLCCLVLTFHLKCL